MTQITIDGVMQGNDHASEEERAAGFERGGWAMGVFDDETGAMITETYRRAEAFLFGRRTYEMFADTWGRVADMRSHPIGVALQRAPKYVVSTTLTEATWAGSTLLRDDPLGAVRALKEAPGGELQVHGSGGLIRWLLANDLVDELTLLVVPVILGQGARLLPEEGPDLALDLVDAHADAKGVVVQTYRPAGRPVYRPNTFAE